ncbi:TetR/AcrR family transcriptional regulator [Anaerotardibacter muris]|uniref:TetR/AcrR family transcriptional regulator n=1 Tax=Anaerotardibacter muris TaxID=2941505 RepID=UPI00203B14DA|nr:TetR/AcrR family transcriptional regulator [Anaerotardibacter muris]
MSPRNKFISAQDTREHVTREKLLETAIDLVNQHGMRYLTIRNICDEAGISTGSFYNLFDDKDDLIAYYLSNIFTSYKQKAEDLAETHTALERVVLIYRFYIDCVLETGIEFITGLYSSITNPAFNFLERDADKELVLDRVRQDLEEGVTSGEVKADLDINEALLRIAIIITGSIYYWCAFEGRIDLTYQADSMLQNYLHSIATDRDRPFNVPPIPRNDQALI